MFYILCCENKVLHFFSPQGFLIIVHTVLVNMHCTYVYIYCLFILYVYAPVDPDFADVLIVLF